MYNYSGFYVNSGDLNLGPHTSTAPVLAIVQSPHSNFTFSSGSWQDLCSEMAIVPVWHNSVLASGK